MVAIGFGPKSIREEKEKRSALANICGHEAGWTSAPEGAGGKDARPGAGGSASAGERPVPVMALPP